MTQRTESIVDDNGTVLATFSADTEMRGVAIQMYGIWHSPLLVAQYIAILGDLNAWLSQNGVN